SILLWIKDKKAGVLIQIDANTLNSIEAVFSKDCQYECLIEIESYWLEKIFSHQLNPQIAMLSEKILVEGKATLAVYFFNLCHSVPHT
ncbi:MAG: hypothetical protein D6780_00530, partial [Candidatus Dadabacteria bacterium]